MSSTLTWQRWYSLYIFLLQVLFTANIVPSHRAHLHRVKTNWQFRQASVTSWHIRSRVTRQTSTSVDRHKSTQIVARRRSRRRRSPLSTHDVKCLSLTTDVLQWMNYVAMHAGNNANVSTQQQQQQQAADYSPLIN